MKTENVEKFNDAYIKGLAPMQVCLEHSDKFSEMKDVREFTDEEKSEYIDELDGRRAKIAEAKINS